MDIIRRFLRKFFPKHFYSKVSELTDSIYVLIKEGIQTLQLLNSKQPGTKQISLKSIKHPFFFRPNIRDREVIIQNLIRNEYDNKINVPIGNGFIIDAGAYIGDVSCYFASKYPCKVISLEPNNDSFNFALKNTSLYPQITLLNKGLWYKEAKLIVIGEGTGSEVAESNNSNYDIDGISLPDLIKAYHIDSIEILKIDIEGAEEAIFAKDITSWIKIVKIILIEIHSESGKELIIKKLKQNNFRIEQYRSIFCCYNDPLINSVNKLNT